MAMESLLDEYVQRLSYMVAFSIDQPTPDGQDVTEWWKDVDPKALAQDLVLREQELGYQVQIISSEIMKWRRIEAQARRCWQIRERQYRQWYDSLYLRAVEPPHDPALKAVWKKPTEKHIEAIIRTSDGYDGWQMERERTEEMLNIALAMVDGLKAKRDMIKAFVGRSRDDAQPQLYV